MTQDADLGFPGPPGEHLPHSLTPQASHPGSLHDPAAVLGNLRVHESVAMGLELGERSLLVSAHKAAITGDVGRQDGCKASLYALGSQGDLPSDVGIIPPHCQQRGPRRRLQRRWVMHSMRLCGDDHSGRPAFRARSTLWDACFSQVHQNALLIGHIPERQHLAQRDQRGAVALLH